MNEAQKKLNNLAREVLILSRNTLLVNLRFLDAALSQFELLPIEKSTLLTDGKHILYNPKHVLEIYKTAKEIPVRDYLHIVMHCVFKHMYMNPTLNRPYWDRSFKTIMSCLGSLRWYEKTCALISIQNLQIDIIIHLFYVNGTKI